MKSILNWTFCSQEQAWLTWILGQFSMCSSCGMVFVTTTASKHALLMRWMAGPEKIPCVRIAYTFVAPASTSLSAAWTIVPQVSAMSSTKMATRSLTSPTWRLMESFMFKVFLFQWVLIKASRGMRFSLLTGKLRGNKQDKLNFRRF